MHGPFWGEFMGTMVLIVLGDGAVANVLLKKSKGENSGWIVIATAWGITLAVAILSKNWSNVGPFWIAQILGAFTGAFLVWLVYLPHWKETPDASAKLGVFCTAPAIRNIPANLLCETLVTMLLVIVGFSFGSKELAPAGLAPGFSPWFWGVLVWVLGLSLGGPTGYAINPARDFGPRLAHAVFPLPGKGNSDWGYALVPIMGPLVGGALAAGIVKLAGIA